MARTWALGDLLATLFERRAPAVPLPARQAQSLPVLCKALMSGRGEVSGMKLAAAVLARWRAADDTERRAFFDFLANDLDLNPEAVAAAAAAYGASRNAAMLRKLHEAAEPPRQELLRRLNQAPGGTVDLVAMRVALMKAMADDPALACIDLDFQHLFASWFNRGFLVLRRIDWTSPAALLERLIAYEAVHEIQSWDDLRRRVAPEDRRCFAFFHPALPDDPLIFVEVALTRGIPGAIAPILELDRPTLPADQADTAVFYSISNCQEGLRGISFGNSLIKQVVEVLGRELPQLSTFVTLSPLPGLARWAEETGHVPADPADGEAIRALAARFLLEAKARDGQPRDPVARFHLGNGAEIKAIHAAADTSPRGAAQSYGAMVNYLYDPARVEENHETYATKGTVMAAREIRALAAG